MIIVCVISCCFCCCFCFFFWILIPYWYKMAKERNVCVRISSTWLPSNIYIYSLAFVSFAFVLLNAHFFLLARERERERDLSNSMITDYSQRSPMPPESRWWAYCANTYNKMKMIIKNHFLVVEREGPIKPADSYIGSSSE